MRDDDLPHIPDGSADEASSPIAHHGNRTNDPVQGCAYQQEDADSDEFDINGILEGIEDF